jgi:Glycogen recognition site of AMP-activated protein kinase
VEGSFDNWTTRQPMQRSGKDFTIVKLLPPGVYQVSASAERLARAAGDRHQEAAATVLPA